MRKFNKGEKVVVERKVTRRSKDWANGWADGMDDYIGNTYTVRYHDRNGVYFDEDDGCFGFPPRSLRLIKLEDAYLFQRGDMVQVVKSMPDWLYWVGSMESWVGGTFKVRDNSKQKNNGELNRVELVDDDGRNFYFPCEAVRLVSKGGKYKDAPKPVPSPPPSVEPLQDWERF